MSSLPTAAQIATAGPDDLKRYIDILTEPLAGVAHSTRVSLPVKNRAAQALRECEAALDVYENDDLYEVDGAGLLVRLRAAAAEALAVVQTHAA